LGSIKKTQVIICPPFVYLSPLSTTVSTTLLLGTQNAFYEEFGAFTGEVSFSQLPQFNVGFVIVGHSERRAMGEDNNMVNKKVRGIVGEGITAILCIGENIRDSHGEYLSFVREQITSGLRDVSKKMLDHLVIAYEPVWAIGEKNAMNSREIHEMYIFIKKILHEMYGTLGDSVRILYGGSVNTFNAEEILKNGFVQGFLIGRESVNAKDFVEIVKLVDRV
jgi:triosephosphate isomerase